jgi:hypothetical protein
LQASLTVIALFTILSVANCLTTGNRFLFCIFVKFRIVVGGGHVHYFGKCYHSLMSSTNFSKCQDSLTLISYECPCFIDVWKQYFH